MRSFFASLAISLISIAPLAAQEQNGAQPTQEHREQGRFAVVLSYSGFPGLGIYYALSDRLALRPMVSINHNSMELEYGKGRWEEDRRSTGFRVGADLLYTFGSVSEFSWYGGVGYFYGETSSEYTYLASSGSMEPEKQRDESMTTTVGVLFGGRYSVAGFLSFFGDLGVQYTSGTQRRTESEYSFRSIQSYTSTIGALLYFK